MHRDLTRFFLLSFRYRCRSRCRYRRAGRRVAGWVPRPRWASWGLSTFEPSLGAEPADASTPAGLFSPSRANPGCASRPYRLKSLRDRGARRRGFCTATFVIPTEERLSLNSLHRNRTHCSASRTPAGTCHPGTARKVEEPARVPLPHAWVAGSVSKTKRSIGIEPDPEADHPDAALFRWGIAG